MKNHWTYPLKMKLASKNYFLYWIRQTKPIRNACTWKLEKDIHLIWPFILFKWESVTKCKTCSIHRKCNQELNKISPRNEPKKFIFLYNFIWMIVCQIEFHIFQAKNGACKNPSQQMLTSYLRAPEESIYSIYNTGVEAVLWSRGQTFLL